MEKRKKSKKAAPKSNANPIDVHVGNRVKFRRVTLGISQDQLGKAIGLTFQQIQKYERGSNRISASKLYEIGKMLEVPISFFFEELPSTGPSTKKSTSRPLTEATDISHEEYGSLDKRETLELVKNYHQITDAKLRDSFRKLLAATANSCTKK